MSILADLLSKNKLGESQGGKEIPPTLARAQNAAAAKRSPHKRYLVIVIAALVVIAVGVALSSKFGPLLTRKPVKYPLPPAATSIAPPQQPAQPVPVPAPAPPPTAEPQPRPKAAFATRQAPKSHKRSAARSAAAHGKIRTGPSHTTAPKQAADAEPPMKSVPPPMVDTAGRGALLYAARSAEQAGDWRSALSNYRQALEVDPDNYQIMNNAAAALNNLGMFEEGAQMARKALDRRPNYLPAMINAAIAYSSQGNSKEALRLFAAASSSDPTNRNLAVNLGILQERTGKLDEAMATYRRLAVTGDPLALMGLGRIAERKGNRAEAAHNYRQVVMMRDASPAQKKEAKEKLARLEE